MGTPQIPGTWTPTNESVQSQPHDPAWTVGKHTVLLRENAFTNARKVARTKTSTLFGQTMALTTNGPCPIQLLIITFANRPKKKSWEHARVKACFTAATNGEHIARTNASGAGSTPSPPRPKEICA